MELSKSTGGPVADAADLAITQAAGLLRAKKLSPVELAQACLARIQKLNPTLNAFITVTDEIALAQARDAEAEIIRGEWRGPLHGIPIALKDLIDTAGVRTTAASALFENRIPKEDAEVVRRLRRSGAVLIGKTNLHEFAYGASSVISHFGPTRNPRNPQYITGGSSGGSAAALAAGMCLGAIGTDTAGSIRLPASFCGVVGLKPSYGLVSARGVIPLAWSYDHVGPLARTAEDAAIMLQAIAGYDAEDIYSREFASVDFVDALRQDSKLFRVGMPREPFYAQMDSEIERIVGSALKTAGEMGDGLSDVAVPLEPDRVAADCESFTFHAANIREDGELYQPSTLERLLVGESISASKYIKARQRLERMRRAAVTLFQDIDVLVAPTVPVQAPTIAELEADLPNLRKREIVMLRNTRPFNVLGLPTISVPCGTTSGGLPVGLQIAGAPGRDDIVLGFAHRFMQASVRSSSD